MTRSTLLAKPLGFGIAAGLFIGTTVLYMYAYINTVGSVEQVVAGRVCDCTLKLAISNGIKSERASKAANLSDNYPDKATESGGKSKNLPLTKLFSKIKTSLSSSTSRLMNIKSKAVYIPNIGMCDGCLAGKQLMTLHTAWFCGQSRFGNKLFMMAPIIVAAASWRNITFVLPQREGECVEWIDTLSDLLLSVNETVPRLPLSMMKDWAATGEQGFTKYSPLRWSKHNITLAGYLQTWKYFEGNLKAQAVRNAFRFTSKYETASANIIDDSKSKFSITNPIFVGVHMRIGDLGEDLRLDYGYQMANQSFYINALEAVSNHFRQSKSIIFLVASDTLEEAKNMLSVVENLYNIYWLHGSAFEDFAALSKCNHSIISGGTYGFWAAWLAGGETFYFSNFSRPGSDFAKEFISENFYLSRWRPIGVN